MSWQPNMPGTWVGAGYTDDTETQVEFYEVADGDALKKHAYDESKRNGHDQGAENWAAIASLVETCKLHGVDPQAYFADVLTKLVNLWPASRLDELMPWAWAARRSTDRLAA